VPDTAETSQQYLAGMIANTSDAIIALDEHFHLLELNPAAEQVLGVAASEVVGHECSEVLRCQNLNRMKLCGTSSCPLHRVLQQKKPLSNEELVMGSEAEHAREVSASVTPVLTDHGAYAVFTARDLSALKVANQVRSNFVSMVSHELRTPLNSVHGFIDLLLQGHMGELNEEQRTYLGYAQEGVQQLISIVQDILFMTRSDLGQFETRQQEVQLRVLVRQVISSMQPQASKASVVLRSDIPADVPLLYVDPQRIKQVLNNLVANAIKYTPPGGTITINVSRLNEEWLMISVIDTGYGILPEDRPYIFERFYQSNQREQSKMGGYGLGLSIARLIVELHGGTINFESAVEQGTTFYFTMPVYRGQDKEITG
jgi:two-component system phosphate regulon sensor histidine kinase PhoR